MKSFKWALIQYDWCSYEKRKLGHRHTHREDHVKGRRQTEEVCPTKAPWSHRHKGRQEGFSPGYLGSTALPTLTLDSGPKTGRK